MSRPGFIPGPNSLIMSGKKYFLKYGIFSVEKYYLYFLNEKIMKEFKLSVIEFPTFEAAWEVAKSTRESFDYYQGMQQKIQYIREAQRWFVTEDGKLWYSYVLQEGLRIIHEATPSSCLSDSLFQYIQIMVSPYNKTTWEETHDQAGVLRFSGQFGDRDWACKISKQMEAAAFNK